MSNPLRARIALERLEARENPSGIETFNSVTPPALPTGWSQWSSDGTTVFNTAAGQGVGGSIGVISSGESRTAGLAWQSQQVSGDTGAAVTVLANSLVPTFVFARGTNLGTSTPTYLAATITRGASVTVEAVTNGSAKILATVNSPLSAYFSGGWVQVSLTPSGTSVAVQVIRQDTGQYLNGQGTWQSAATNAITVTTAIPDAPGDIGVGRVAMYAGSVDLDNFDSLPPPPPVEVTQSFDTTPAGQLPAGWSGWTSGSPAGFVASTTLALSGTEGFTSTGTSTSSARAWSTTSLATNVTASAAVYLDSLIPAQLFVRGSNLNTTTPTYYAVTITRGLDVDLVRVVNGVATTLATLQSASYFSGQWVQVQLTAVGSELQVSVYRADTQKWLNAGGVWSSSPACVFDLQDTAITAGGDAGVGRSASYSGAVTFDNFVAGPPGTVAPTVTVTSSAGAGPVSGAVTFQATTSGTAVTFVLNGQIWTTSTATPTTLTIDTPTLANGSYTLTVLAGVAGGLIGSTSETFTINNPAGSSEPPLNATPTAAGAYSPVSGTLFGPNGPSPLDVQQGSENDCWFIASLAEVAARDPADIVHMFTYDGTALENGSVVGVYTVRFYNSSGTPEYVTLDTELPDGGQLYDRPVNGVLWVALAEKAYAEANAAGFVTTADPGINSYDALGNINDTGGDPRWALQAITGQPTSDISVNPTNIAAAWNSGQLIVLTTVTPASSDIVSSHCYAVVGYNPSSSTPFEILNAWGGTTSSVWCPQDTQVYGLFNATAAFLSQNFTVVSLGTGAAAG
jgi:hypothetical protein